jgi:hyperosmotically inducible protein
MKRAWVCLLVSFALALPLMGQQERTGGGRYDQQIQQAVHKELQKHDTFKTIRASVEDGIVTLQGQVPFFVDKVKAEKEVRKIEHVAGVRNQVQVSSTVADAVLRQKLADKLRYDRIGFGILYNNLTLKVHDGVVTVGGQVLDYPSEMSAIGIVQTEPGVKDVIDDIQVLPTSPFDDALRIKLARAIYGQPSMQKYAIDPQAPIRIVVHNGHVTLNGVVDSAMDKQIAGIQAGSVPGVFDVKNNLIVEKQPTGK